MLDGCRAHASEGDCDMEGRWQLQRHLRVTVESMDRLGVADGHELELKRGVAVNRSGQLDNARLNRLPPVEQGAVLCVLVDVVSGRRARWRCDNATVCQSVTASTRMLAPVRNSPCGAEAQFPAHLFLGHDNCSWPSRLSVFSPIEGQDSAITVSAHVSAPIDFWANRFTAYSRAVN
jgi:hypothetical protein